MPDLSHLVADLPLVFLVVAGLVILDALVPLVPSETLLVAGGVFVASGDIPFLVLVAAGVAGAFAGHLILYALGKRAAPTVERRLIGKGNNTHRMDRVRVMFGHRPWLVSVADFVPWGRTLIMFVAGASGMSPRKFMRYAALGAVVWSSFFTLIGVWGGSMFESEWHSLAIALTFVVIVSAVCEILTRGTLDNSSSHHYEGRLPEKTEPHKGTHVNVRTVSNVSASEADLSSR